MSAVGRTRPAALVGPRWGERIAAFDRPLLLLGLLLTVVVLAYFRTPTDPDVWWHLRNGQVVWSTGTVPHGDIYSYTVPGARWIMQQWLLEAIMAALAQTLGYWADVLLFGLVSAGVYALLFRTVRAEGAGRALAVGVVLSAALLDAPGWGVRPQVWTTLFFVVFLAVLLGYRLSAFSGGIAAPPHPWRGHYPWLWLLPPLMLIWANFHAGFTVGLLLLAAFGVGEAGNRLLGWPAAPMRPLLAVAAACAAVSLLNPNGLDLWLYPLTYLGGAGGNASLRFVQEWQPPDLRTLQGAPFAATLLALGALNLLHAPGSGGQRRGNAALMLALAGVTLMAFQAVRFLPLYGAVWAVVVAERIAAVWPGGNVVAAPAPPGHTAAISRRGFGRLNLGIYLATTAALAAVLLTGPRAQVHAAPLETNYPAGALAYLAAAPAPLPRPLHLFNEYGWGGYLIAHGWPVFVDGRADPYNALLPAYMAASAGIGWQALFAREGVNGVLVRTGAPLDGVLAATPGWSLAYRDALAVLYLRH